MISCVLFSYKNKNLKKVVDELILNTKNEIFIVVFDKHNLDRKNLFSDLMYKNKVEYRHIVWDEMKSPIDYKKEILYNSSSEYFLSISDDILVSKDWDEESINFLKTKDVVLSGCGELTLEKKNLFFFKQLREKSLSFNKTSFIDKNFIFCKTSMLKGIYPNNLKYFGEDEMLSLNLFNRKTEIFSLPSKLYKDLLVRSIENSYTTFSLEHNYNLVIEQYKKAPEEFLIACGIDRDSLYPLPYAHNDVDYNPDELSFQDLDARKFVMDIRGIY
jgi:hypothetical protein